MNRLPHRIWLRTREVAVPRTAPPLLDELRRVAAEQDHPRLDVRRSCGGWRWVITAPDGRLLDGATAATHGQALAVGLAALEQASVARPASA